MKHSRFSNVCLSLVAVLVTAMLLPGNVSAQTTTSSIRVVVTNDSGQAVADVPLEVVHLPTGRTATTTSNSSGIANARGLAVGGPYRVSVADGANYGGQTTGDIITQLDETEVVSLVVRSSIEEITVTGQQGGQAIQVGVGRDFDRATIDAIPSISRDFVSALATEPKILVDNSVARGPAVSMAGQNFRFNSVTIDGVAQNDNFGLSKNASATQRAPISIDAI